MIKKWLKFLKTSGIIILLLILILTLIKLFNQAKEPQPGTEKGLFINFGRNSFMIFKNKSNIDKAIAYAREIKVKNIYLHVYANDMCYFKAGKLTSDNYKGYCQKAGEDLLGYFLKQAGKEGMKCYAWVNCFAFMPSKIWDHRLLKKYGKNVLSKDQYNRYFDGKMKKNSRDKYYWRNELVWLEPGDKRVQKYLLNIFQTLLDNYPQLEGLMLDFIRYPIDPPFMPGSRYIRWGYSSGYGEQNLKQFNDKHGFYPTINKIAKKIDGTVKAYHRSILWNQWRRKTLTSFVSNIHQVCGKKKLTAAVFPYPEMMFLHGFQHWRKWLEKDYMDYVVMMSYTLNPEYLYFSSKLASETYPGKIRIGLGCYLMNNYPEMFQQQMDILHKLKISGIAYYEYFDNRKLDNLQKMIRNYKVKDIDLDQLSMPDIKKKSK